MFKWQFKKKNSTNFRIFFYFNVFEITENEGVLRGKSDNCYVSHFTIVSSSLSPSIFFLSPASYSKPSKNLRPSPAPRWLQSPWRTRRWRWGPRGTPTQAPSLRPSSRSSPLDSHRPLLLLLRRPPPKPRPPSRRGSPSSRRTFLCSSTLPAAPPPRKVSFWSLKMYALVGELFWSEIASRCSECTSSEEDAGT